MHHAPILDQWQKLLTACVLSNLYTDSREQLLQRTTKNRGSRARHTLGYCAWADVMGTR